MLAASFSVTARRVRGCLPPLVGEGWRRGLSANQLPLGMAAAIPRPIGRSASAPPPKADPSPNLFISGLSKRTTTEKLRDFAATFGEVMHARVVTDRVTGFSKGFGFVRYSTVEDAGKGIEGMDGKFLDGWVIFAEYARPRAPPQQPEMNSQPQQSWGPPSGYWGAQ